MHRLTLIFSALPPGGTALFQLDGTFGGARATSAGAGIEVTCHPANSSLRSLSVTRSGLRFTAETAIETLTVMAPVDAEETFLRGRVSLPGAATVVVVSPIENLNLFGSTSWMLQCTHQGGRTPASAAPRGSDTASLNSKDK